MRLNVMLALLLIGCGDGDPVGDIDGGATADAFVGTGRYMPVSEGTSWTYQVTDTSSGEQATKVTTVMAEEDVGGMKAGTTAFKVVTLTTDASGMDRTESWQEDTGTALVRHREITYDRQGNMSGDEFYDPFKLRLDEADDRIVPGAMFMTSYVETRTDALGTTTNTRNEIWTIEAVDQEITVPAGTFSCIRVRRMGTEPGQSDKTYWFARGVGKIKESGGQTEDLVSSTLL
jgi:hypothetical protein